MTGNLLSQSTSRTIYPTNHVIAILDEAEDAQLAVEALRQAGFDETNILLITNIPEGEEISNQRSPWRFFDRIRSMVTNVVCDESPYQEMYEQVIKEGHHMVSVHVFHQDEQVLAATIMKNHRGHAIKFFGWWAITSHL